MKKIKRMIRAARNNPLSKWNTFLNFMNKKNREFKKFKKKQIVKDKEFREKVGKVVREKREVIKEKNKVVKENAKILKGKTIEKAKLLKGKTIEKTKIVKQGTKEKYKIIKEKGKVAKEQLDKKKEETKKYLAEKKEEQIKLAEIKAKERIEKEKAKEALRIEKEKEAEKIRIQKEKEAEEIRIQKEKEAEEIRIQKEKEEIERVVAEQEKKRLEEEQQRIMEQQQRIIEEQQRAEELKQVLEAEKAKRLEEYEKQQKLKIEQEQQEQENFQDEIIEQSEKIEEEIPKIFETSDFSKNANQDEVIEIAEDEIPIVEELSAEQIVEEMEAENRKQMKEEQQQKIEEFKERKVEEMKEIFKKIKQIIKTLVKNIKTKIKSRRVLTLESAMPKEITVEYSPKSYISESFRTLRTNIQFMNANKNIKSILVTSTMPGEGKSYVATNLAATFAQANKKVVVVDADMRKGRVHEIFKVAKQPGLSNYLSGVATIEDSENIDNYIKETCLENLYVLPMGNTPPNPSELISTEKMKKLIAELSIKFDVVIFDGTPSKIVTDSVILSREVDTTLIVTGHNKTKMDDLKKVQKDIENVGGKLAGVVINNVPINTKKYADSYYYENVNVNGNRTKKIKKMFSL